MYLRTVPNERLLSKALATITDTRDRLSEGTLFSFFSFTLFQVYEIRINKYAM